jgi:hypothetical protein
MGDTGGDDSMFSELWLLLVLSGVVLILVRLGWHWLYAQWDLPSLRSVPLLRSLRRHWRHWRRRRHRHSRHSRYSRHSHSPYYSHHRPRHRPQDGRP